MTKPKCFIIMPISTSEEIGDYHGDPNHFEHLMECLFYPAIESAGFRPCSPRVEGSDMIHGGIIKHLEEDEMVLCDMTTLNANVFFEFGIRTALNKPICLVKDSSVDRIPFDASGINTHTYNPDLRDWIVREERPKLAEHIKATANRGQKNALWSLFGLQEQAKKTSIESSPLEAKVDLLLARTRQPKLTDKETLILAEDNIMSWLEQTFEDIVFRYFRNRNGEFQLCSDTILSLFDHNKIVAFCGELGIEDLVIQYAYPNGEPKG